MEILKSISFKSFIFTYGDLSELFKICIFFSEIVSIIFLLIKAFFIQLMLEKGFLASNLFYAMFAHKTNHVDHYLKAVEESFYSIRKAMDSGTVREELKGKPSGTGFKRLT